jgi:L-cysteine S-thiosulfotransferase
MRRWRSKWLGVLAASVAVSAAAQPLRSGQQDMGLTLQAMQADDSQNPGMLWVQQGLSLFGEHCLACHQASRLRTVSTRFPALVQGQLRSLTQQLQVCQTRLTKPVALDEEALLALGSYLGYLGRGLKLEAVRDRRLLPALRRGEFLFRQPMGQLGLSCAHCHQTHAGQRLAGSLIPQGHPNGYPAYRLEWQGMGSLERRLRGCLTGVRAEPWGPDSKDAVALALFLRHRAAGLIVETPAVRP